MCFINAKNYPIALSRSSNAEKPRQFGSQGVSLFGWFLCKQVDAPYDGGAGTQVVDRLKRVEGSWSNLNLVCHRRL
jgi:hypothetical protein